MDSKIPPPPIFRRKKYGRKRLTKAEKTDNAIFEAIPRFFEYKHPTTQWLINMVRTENEKELLRVLYDKQSKSLLQFEPDKGGLKDRKTVIAGQKDFVITKTKYFQIPDRPEKFVSGECRTPSLFNRHAIMYLTPLGLAIYLKKPKVVRMFCECIDRDTNMKMILARQPQFVSFINDRFGDIFCMYDHSLAMYNEAFDELSVMLTHDNWFPMEPFRLIYRKRYVETYLNFDDFMDYAFYSLFTGKSYLNIAKLSQILVNSGSQHFKVNYMCQPTRANKKTLLRDAEKIINNCKTYPRRLLRCAYYADKELLSTYSLIRAAATFINTGMFLLQGEPAIPFLESSNRKKRLEHMIDYEERKRSIDVVWPAANYEFDTDCCIALLLGLMAKCHRFGKWSCFRSSMLLLSKLLADSSWLNYFDVISDLEFKDYFMGLDDAEKVRFKPEVFGYVRECVKLQLIDNANDLTKFFTVEKLEQKMRKAPNPIDNDFLASLVTCQDSIITRYVTIPKGEKLKMESTIVCGPRVRGSGRDDPSNKYFADILNPPAQTIATTMINTSCSETEEDYSDSESHSTDTRTTDSVEQNVNIKKVPDIVKTPNVPTTEVAITNLANNNSPTSSHHPIVNNNESSDTRKSLESLPESKPKPTRPTKATSLLAKKLSKKPAVKSESNKKKPGKRINNLTPVKPFRRSVPSKTEDTKTKASVLGGNRRTSNTTLPLTVGKIVPTKPKTVGAKTSKSGTNTSSLRKSFTRQV